MIRNHISRTVSPSVQRTLDTAPLIPAIAARAKAAAAAHREFIRGDQGQVVGVRPDLEVYYGPSSGLPELRHAGMTVAQIDRLEGYLTTVADRCQDDGSHR